MIGKRALDDPRNHLVYHFVRMVSELKPKYFIFENVRGLTIGGAQEILSRRSFRSSRRRATRSRRSTKFLTPSISAYHRIGSACSSWAPGGDSASPSTQRQSHALPGANLDLGFTERTPTVWEALGDLPEADDYEELLERDWVEANFARPSQYAKSLRAGSGKIAQPSHIEPAHDTHAAFKETLQMPRSRARLNR